MKKAVKYSRWMEGGARQGVADNEFLTDGDRLKLPATLAMSQHSPECFDEDYYARKNAVRAPTLASKNVSRPWNC